MVLKLRRATLWTSLSLSLSLAGQAAVQAAAPPLEQALGLLPVQREIEFDQPKGDAAKKCAIQAEAIGPSKGWVIRDGMGQVLRKFADTNGDNVVDQWSYYSGGIEVYRDIDSNHNGKADQYRWLNTAGTRWGIDANEDGKVDSWKNISAEEVSAEFVKALTDRDDERFKRLLLTDSELGELGVSADREKELGEKLGKATPEFKEVSRTQKIISPKAEWVQFAATRPALVPEGTEGSTKDMVVYENVVALIDGEGKHSQVPIGTLVQVGPVWRMIAMPNLLDTQTAGASDFLRPYMKLNNDEPAPGGPDTKVQELLAKLEKLDQDVAKATPEQVNALNDERIKALEDLAATAGTPEDRNQWRRQLADTISAAMQAGTLADGADRLTALFEQLKGEAGSEDLAAYVKFRLLTAEYGRSIQEGSDLAKVQEKWLTDLDQYVKDFPKSADASEALLQLAIGKEFAGQEDEAKELYGRIVTDFSQSAAATKAAGAKLRLESVGKPIPLRGMMLGTKKPIDLAQLKGKVVLVQYWATWCEPCIHDMAELKELQAKYGKSGFVVLGVNLDANPQDVQTFLKERAIAWPQIYEPGGLDSRLANELGILTLPTMILVDEKGNVINRNIHVTQVDSELKKRFK